MPEDLQTLLELFADQHQKYADPVMAHNMCGAAADEFMDLLTESPHYTFREVHFISSQHLESGENSRWWGLITPRFPYTLGPQLYHDGLPHCMGHIVVEIRELDLCVDWTARQFCADAPFPFIFPSPKLKGKKWPWVLKG